MLFTISLVNLSISAFFYVVLVSNAVLDSLFIVIIDFGWSLD